MNQSLPIETYLDELADRLTITGSELRRVLAEVDDHLRDSAAAEQASGTDSHTAELRAVTAFGPANEFARQISKVRVSRASLLAALSWPGVLLIATGFVVIGISGVLAEFMRLLVGENFVAGDAPGITYTGQWCAEFLSFSPDLANCSDAAVRHHFAEVIDTRLGVGLMGMVALAGWFVAKRRYRRSTALQLLSRQLLPSAGAAVFGSVGALMLAISLLEMFGGSSAGAGATLSAGLSATAASIGFATEFVRRLRVAQT